MDLIIVLILGAIIGWLGARVVGRREGILASMAIGIVGAIIGDTVARWVGVSASYLGFSWPGIFWAFIGAVILSTLLNLLQHRSMV